MNILMLCARFPLEPGNEYLTNELADALVADGHEVQVVVIDWDAPSGAPARELTTPEGVRVLSLAPVMLKGIGQFVEKATKWLASPAFAARAMKAHLAGRSFDAMICFSPATVSAAQALWAYRKFRPRSYLVQWDFFPFHQRSIGLIPNSVAFSVARRIEQAMMRRFDVIGCMSPMNIAYLRDHYALRPQQKVELLPIWGKTSAPLQQSNTEVRARYGLPLDRHIVVFGGQITEGRGIEEILAAADHARQKRPDIAFLLIGQGRLAGLVKAHIAGGGTNVMYRDRIPRADYLSLVSVCDIGLVVTMRDVDVPTFPSKIIDYLRAGIPVVASVEATTDYGHFIAERGVGKAIQAGSPAELLEAIEIILDNAEERAAMSDAGRKCLEEIFDVKHAADRISKSLRSHSLFVQ